MAGGVKMKRMYRGLSGPTKDDLAKRKGKQTPRKRVFACSCVLHKAGTIELCDFHRGMEVGYDAALVERFL